MPRREKGNSPRGYFGVAVYQPKTSANIGTLWRSATVYGATFMATVGRRYDRQPSDTCNSPIHTPLFHYADLADLMAHLPHSCPLIGVELASEAVPLHEFTHLPRSLYLLGAEDRGLPPAALAQCHQIVQIASPIQWSLNVAVAGSLVMYDRYVKRQTHMSPFR